jgi:uncharacterized protein
VLGNPSVLLLYGERDRFTPPAHGERMKRAFGDAASMEMHVLPGVDHTFAYRDAPQRYVEGVMPFLERLAR